MLREKVTPAPPPGGFLPNDEFDHDMMIFAEDENLDPGEAKTIYSGSSYSRADIDVEHD